MFGQRHMAGVEDLQLRLHPGGDDVLRHGLDMAGHIDQRHLAEVERAHVEAANLRLQGQNMPHALLRAAQVGSRTMGGRSIINRIKARARAGRQVDDDLAGAGADALHHLGVEIQRHAGLAGLGIAHMDMHDRRPGVGRINAGLGDFFRGDGNRRIFEGGVVSAGDGAGEDRFGVHASLLRSVIGRRRACEWLRAPVASPDWPSAPWSVW